MVTQGKVRKVFPGGNTAYGFHSFYDQIIGSEARRVFIVKGGPGVGKSTFMRLIGEAMLARGYDVEFLCCSSDNGSLDGVVIPAIAVALIDGTAPHVLDPRNPGAVDEIIHLGDYWNEAGMRANREQVLRLNREVGHLFARAYKYLAQAKLLNEEIESYYTDTGALRLNTLNRLKGELIESIFRGRTQGGFPSSRHLFASAITPDGCINHFSTVFDGVGRRFILRGGSKYARASLVEKVYREALDRSYFAEAFHCGLIPDYLEHLLIPDLDVALITANEYHGYNGQEGDTLLDLDALVERQALEPYREDLNEAQRRFTAALDRAVDLIRRAKQAHDAMESYYVPNMDFARINSLREQVLARILAYAREAEKEAAAAG